MRETVKAEVTVTLEVPEYGIAFDNDDLADVIRGAVGRALEDRMYASPIEVVAWTVWGAD